MDAPDDLTLAQGGDPSAFERLVAPYRRELLAHCYRLCGSLPEAEDLVQDSLVRAWRGLEGFQRRASVRTWLYTIATRACLTAAGRRARVLPSQLAPAGQEGAAVDEEPAWMTPFPDAWLDEEAQSPEARYTRRQSVTLAFLTALQRLPPRQRAVVVLRDVLGWAAAECAELLETSTASVNSALQRARQSLEAAQAARVPPPAAADAGTRMLLARYVRAWNDADLGALVALLREDAVLTMPPLPGWFQGREAIARALGEMVFPPGSAGRYRARSLWANACPGVVLEERAEGGGFQPRSVHVLALEGGQVARLDAFLEAGLSGRFLGLVP
jgi:RNA polymerase sigma-70 factor (ECF subfamily)